MLAAFFFLFGLFLGSASYAEYLPKSPLSINIICWDNGVGLSHDFKILEEELSLLGHQVRHVPITPPIDQARPEILPANINIFIEHTLESLFPYADKNYFIPNPEWCYANQELLQKYTLILCRTKEVQRIFLSLNCKTYYLGFTSVDKLKKGIQKDFKRILHLRGKSHYKGTSAVLQLWSSNLTLPPLYLISNGSKLSPSTNIRVYPRHICDKKLDQILNFCGIHLCPSETEGFGHSISEAMSSEAVVITTDAPPMNEFILDKRCLVKYNKTQEAELATAYKVDSEDLEIVLKTLLNTPTIELREIGRQNRERYLKQKQAFKERLKKLLEL